MQYALQISCRIAVMPGWVERIIAKTTVTRQGNKPEASDIHQLYWIRLWISICRELGLAR
jgi:hypothetical protein